MNEDRLTEALAVQVMGWRVAPGRFIKAGRAWIPSWRFAPLRNLEDAFDLLDAAFSTYTIRAETGRTFEAEVRVGGSVGKASGEPKARAITLALARALGLEVSAELVDERSLSKRGDRQPSRSNGDDV